jgi:hypothetical protein
MMSMIEDNRPLPAEYARARACCIESVACGDQANLHRAWEQSRERLRAIASLLEGASLDPRIATIALSGSLGRMEGLDHSDADLIVIVESADPLPLAECRGITQHVWSMLAPLKLPRPAGDGIFTAAVNWQSLCDPQQRGQIDESLAVFGTRIQLLLDSQPVWNRSSFDRLLGEIVRRYASGDVLRCQTAPWAYLANDLIRYYRCLAIDAQWRRRANPQAWRVFNLKLAHSRRLLYAGLLWLLGESSQTVANRADWLQPCLRLTPLERVAWVMNHGRSGHLPQVLACYDRFLGCLGDPAFLAALDDGSDADAELDANPAYRQLMDNAQHLAAALFAFLLTRRGIWPDDTLIGWLL